jgi:sialic acid synthase SpsE
MTTVFELGLNHLGDLSRARRMTDTLAAQGAESMTIQVIAEPARLTRVGDAIRFLAKNALTF